MKEVKTENKEEFLQVAYINKWSEWKKTFEILNNEDVIAWLYSKLQQYTRKGKEASKFQIQVYIKMLSQYCQFNEVKNPSDLLLEKIDKRNQRLMSYLNFLINSNDIERIKELGFQKKPSLVSVVNQIQGKRKGFYSNRGVPIMEGIKSEKAGENKNEIELLGEEGKEIIRAIQNKLERGQYRLLFKFNTQTGLRIDDLLTTLTSGKHKIREYSENGRMYYFIKNFKTMKESVAINYLFFTSELTDLLKAVYPNKNLTELDLTTLFKTKNTKKHGSRRINQNDYLKRIKAIGIELGITENIKTHSFRKYFETQTHNNEQNVSMEFCEHLMGHEGQNLSQNYFMTVKNKTSFFKKWKLLENDICIDCVQIDNTNREIIEHKKQIADLELENKELYKDVAEMRAEIKEYSESIKELSNILFDVRDGKITLLKNEDDNKNDK